jgi:hypothetical protein
MAAVGLASGLPAITSTKASTSSGSGGQRTHKAAQKSASQSKSTTGQRRHSSSRSSGLKSPTTSPTSSSSAPAVSSGGS